MEECEIKIWEQNDIWDKNKNGDREIEMRIQNDLVEIYTNTQGRNSIDNP